MFFMPEMILIGQCVQRNSMLRVKDIDNNRAWNLLFEGFSRNYAAIGGK